MENEVASFLEEFDEYGDLAIGPAPRFGEAAFERVEVETLRLFNIRRRGTRRNINYINPRTKRGHSVPVSYK